MNASTNSWSHPVLEFYATALHEIERSVSALLQSITLAQDALRDIDPEMTDSEKKTLLYHTRRILKSIRLLQNCLLSKYELLDQWGVLREQSPVMHADPKASDILDQFRLFTRSHPREWIKIRLLLHEIAAFQGRKAKMPRAYTENIHIRPWLSPLIDNRLSKRYTDN